LVKGLDSGLDRGRWVVDVGSEADRQVSGVQAVFEEPAELVGGLLQPVG
jgi:hypothetical protein